MKDYTPRIQETLNNFCNIVLTTKDYVDYHKTDEFIESIKDEIDFFEPIVNPEKDTQIRSCILNRLMYYINQYQGLDNNNNNNNNNLNKVSLFSFDSGDNLLKHKQYFANKYRETYNHNVHPMFDFAFDYIREVSEHYRIFLAFYDTRTQETATLILRRTEQATQEIVRDSASFAAQEAAKEATATAKIAADNAKTAADKAATDAQNAATDAKNAAADAKCAVTKEMSYVTTKISETSVTILGIFAGIVLTVVAGLFYSSSVLDNINTASFFKLLCVASLIGVVCFDLIVVMFLFIDNFREKTEESIKKSTHLHTFLLLVHIVLILTFVVTGILQIFFPGQDRTSGTIDTGVNESTQIDMPSTDSTESSDSDEQKDNNTTLEEDSQT